MKSKYWAAILACIVLFCLAWIALSSGDTPAGQAQIQSGDRVMTVDLQTDQEFTLESESGGYNTVTVKNGRIAVTGADCPDGYCMDRGFCDSGTPIVCLPHKLTISFLEANEVDGAIG